MRPFFVFLVKRCIKSRYICTKTSLKTLPAFWPSGMNLRCSLQPPHIDNFTQAGVNRGFQLDLTNSGFGRSRRKFVKLKNDIKTGVTLKKPELQRQMNCTYLGWEGLVLVLSLTSLASFNSQALGLASDLKRSQHSCDLSGLCQFFFKTKTLLLKLQCLCYLQKSEINLFGRKIWVFLNSFYLELGKLYLDIALR